MKLTAEGKIDSMLCLGADEKKHAVLNPDNLLGQCMETAVHASRSLPCSLRMRQCVGRIILTE